MFETFIGFGAIAIILFSVFIAWSIFWKGIALWIAAKENKKYWFIAILVLNTVGILEIVYIFFFSERGKKYFRTFKNRRYGKMTSPKNTQE